jgi:hypothetical protein
MSAMPIWFVLCTDAGLGRYELLTRPLDLPRVVVARKVKVLCPPCRRKLPIMKRDTEQIRLCGYIQRKVSASKA